MFSFIRNFFFRNNSASQTVIKNTVWLLGGEVLGRIIRFSLVIYAARILGTAEYGVFSYALSIAALLTLLADFGIAPVLTREASKNVSERSKYFATAFLIKLQLVLIIILATIFLLPQITRLDSISVLIPLIILVFVFDSFREFGFGMNRALEKMELEALIKVFLNLAVVGLGFWVLFTLPTAYNLLIAYVLGTGLAFLATAFILRSYLFSLFRFVDFSLMGHIVKTAIPIGFLQVLGALMLNTDMVMLGWWEVESQIGLYSGANKIILLLYVLPNLIAASAFPAFSRLAKTDKEQFRDIFEKVLATTFLLSLPLVVGGFLTAPALIHFLYGAQYADSVPVLLILLPTILIVFPSTILANALFAHNEQRKFLWFVALGVLSNIALNIVFIPRWGISGVALATLGSVLLTNVFIWQATKKVVSFALFRYIYKALIASLIMGLGVWFFGIYLSLPFLLMLLIAIVLYIVSLILLKDSLLQSLIGIFQGRVGNKKIS